MNAIEKDAAQRALKHADTVVHFIGGNRLSMARRAAVDAAAAAREIAAAVLDKTGDDAGLKARTDAAAVWSGVANRWDAVESLLDTLDAERRAAEEEAAAAVHAANLAGAAAAGANEKEAEEWATLVTDRGHALTADDWASVMRCRGDDLLSAVRNRRRLSSMTASDDARQWAEKLGRPPSITW